MMMDRPHIPLHPRALRNEPPIVVIILDRRMRLAPNDRHAPPPQHLLHKRPHIRQLLLVVQTRRPPRANHPVQLLPRPRQRFWEGAAGEHEGDEGGGARVGARAEEVAGEGGDFLRLEAVFGAFAGEVLDEAVLVAGFGDGFFGERVEEAVGALAAAGAEAVLPGGDFIGELGEDCEVVRMGCMDCGIGWAKTESRRTFWATYMGTSP